MRLRDSAQRRLARVLRERRGLAERLRRGAIDRDEYVTALRSLVVEARLHEPSLERPWWADDLGWLMRAIAQAIHSHVLREGEHVVFLQREGGKLRRTSFDACRCLAVDFESALAAMAAFGFSLSPAGVDHILAAKDDSAKVVVEPRVRVYFRTPRRWRQAAILDWMQVQSLGATPRRGDPRVP